MIPLNLEGSTMGINSTKKHPQTDRKVDRLMGLCNHALQLVKDSLKLPLHEQWHNLSYYFSEWGDEVRASSGVFKKAISDKDLELIESEILRAVDSPVMDSDRIQLMGSLLLLPYHGNASVGDYRKASKVCVLDIGTGGVTHESVVSFENYIRDGWIVYEDKTRAVGFSVTRANRLTDFYTLTFIKRYYSSCKPLIVYKRSNETI